MKRDDVILVRGGGDLATGTIHRLWSAGLKVLEMCIRDRFCLRLTERSAIPARLRPLMSRCSCGQATS